MYENTSEFAIEWLRGAKTATVTAPCGSKLNHKIKKLAEKYPEEVTITHENADGSLVAHIPVEYIKVSKPASREMSDEQKEAAAVRLAEAREKREKQRKIQQSL